LIVAPPDNIPWYCSSCAKNKPISRLTGRPPTKSVGGSGGSGGKRRNRTSSSTSSPTKKKSLSTTFVATGSSKDLAKRKS
jgi:hypothetical protein